MSTSRHPIALRIERAVGGSTKLLATVMALPLIDGIFPALVIAGALTTPAGNADPLGIAETGLLIFGGSATVAVVLAEMDGTPREKAVSILMLGAVLIPLAVAEAALAQTIESLLSPVFHRFAGLVILAIAAKTASAEVGEYLPRPGAIIALGLVASFDPAGFEFDVSLDPGLLASAGAAAAVGVGFALAVALAGDRLRGHVDIDRFRFGSALALGMLALTVTDLLATSAPVALGVLCVTAVFSYDPSGPDDPAPDATDAGADGAATAATADGGATGIDPVDGDGAEEVGGGNDDGGEANAPRAPWL
ncbi:DUF5794 domain-containing protein [Candidatus Halobonum tyrrellensis]|uniref:Uncharacterized protein n=1 Tax=Candidatus Halobonum tyrrellensis G22 TaxID=1324957 RepID=V4HEN7_9EURY|nr:DUF5794 domain-containing protein [Candidatus Halobonum tyrrellensis]ESP89175.1 hypothetical protein K933_05303 [Candidatus Halobonum tyrrellensis G22]